MLEFRAEGTDQVLGAVQDIRQAVGTDLPAASQTSTQALLTFGSALTDAGTNTTKWQAAIDAGRAALAQLSPATGTEATNQAVFKQALADSQQTLDKLTQSSHQAATAETAAGQAAQQATTAHQGLGHASHAAESSFAELLKTGMQLALGFATVEGALHLVKETLLEAVTAAADYGVALQQMGTIGHLTATQVEEIAAELEQINPALGTSTDLAQQFVVAFRGTHDAARAMEEVTQAAILAKATQSDLASTTRELATIMGAFGLTQHETAHAADVLYTAWANQRGTLQEFTQGLERVGPLVAGLGGTMEDAAATLAALGDVMGSTPKAAFTLQTALSALSQHHLELARRGIDVAATLNGPNGLMNLFTQLAPILAGNRDEAAALGLQGRALGGILELVGNAAQRNADIHKEMGQAVGSAAKASEEAINTYKEAVKTLGHEWERFTNTVMPPVLDVLAKGITLYNEYFESASRGKAGLVALRDEEDALTNAWRAGTITTEAYRKGMDALHSQQRTTTESARQAAAAAVAQAAAHEAGAHAADTAAEAEKRKAEADRQAQVAAQAEAQASHDAAVVAEERAQAAIKVTQAETQEAASSVQQARLFIEAAQGRRAAAIATATAVYEAAKQSELSAKIEQIAAQQTELAAKAAEVQLSRTLSEKQKANEQAVIGAQQVALAQQAETLTTQKAVEAQHALSAARLKAATDAVHLAAAQEQVTRADESSAASRVRAAESIVQAEAAVLQAARATGQGASDAALKIAEADLEAARQSDYYAKQKALDAQRAELAYEAIAIAARTYGSEEQRAADLAVNAANDAALAAEQRAARVAEATRREIQDIQEAGQKQTRIIEGLSAGGAELAGILDQIASSAKGLTHEVYEDVGAVALLFGAWDKTILSGEAAGTTIAGLSEQIRSLTIHIGDLNVGLHNVQLYDWVNPLAAAQEMAKEESKIVEELSAKLLRLAASGKEAGAAFTIFGKEIEAADSRLQAAYDILGTHSSDALKRMADAAVQAFQIAQRSGTSTAEHLEDIWVHQVVPKIEAAYGEIPAKFAQANAAIINAVDAALQLLGAKSDAMLKKEADAALTAYKTIEGAGIATGQNLVNIYEHDVLPKIEAAYGKLTQTVAHDNAAMLQSTTSAVTQASQTAMSIVSHDAAQSLEIVEKTAADMAGLVTDATMAMAQTTGTVVAQTTTVAIGALEQIGQEALAVIQTIGRIPPIPGNIPTGTTRSATSSPSNSFVPAFQHGTPYVPWTGLFQLEQGERVVPAAQNTSGRDSAGPVQGFAGGDIHIHLGGVTVQVQGGGSGVTPQQLGQGLEEAMRQAIRQGAFTYHLRQALNL